MLPEAPRRPANWPLFLRQFVTFAGLMVVFIPCLITVAVLTRGGNDRRWLGMTVGGEAMMRWWGRVNMRLLGVRVDVTPDALAELTKQRRRVVTFNHTSTMDMFLMTVVWPPAASAVVKREMLDMPLFGMAMRRLPFVPIHRGNASALDALADAGAFVKAHDRTVMIAPEGTRSPTGRLRPFKLGAIHMAMAADAPIVPVYLEGPGDLWPVWQRHCAPGVVTIRLLQELPSGADDPSHAGIHARHAALTAVYTEAESACVDRV